MSKNLCFALTLAVLAATAVEAQAPDSSAATLLAALRTGDAAVLATLFDSTVRFDGEGRIVGEQREGRLVLPASAQRLQAPGERPSNFVAIELSGQDLAAAYARLAQSRPEPWGQLMAAVKPTLVRVTTDGEHYEHARAGDYVYDLHLREGLKGKRSGLDEALLFVFREVGGRYVVVVHWGDL